MLKILFLRMGYRMPHVFLSYGREDGPLAEQIRNLVTNKVDVWQDVHSLEGGELYENQINEAIDNSRCLLLLLSPLSFNSEYVRNEVKRALDKNIPVIPLLRGFRAGDLPNWWQTRLGSFHMLTVAPLTQARKEAVLSALDAHLRPLCRTVAVFNQKGGVGKTTLAAQLAARLNLHHGKRVLMVDLDPQQNLTELYLTPLELENQLHYLQTICGMFEPSQIGVEVTEAKEFDTYLGRARVEDIEIAKLALSLNQSGSKPIFDIIAGDHRSIKYVRVGEHPILFENFTLTIAEARKHYDVIVFDCNPSVSFFTRAIMENADFLLLPLRPDGFARRGVVFLQKVIETFYELERRPQVNAVFNFVTANNQPRYERDTISRLKEDGPLAFKGTDWLRGGYLDTQIRESSTLRPRTQDARVGERSVDRSSLIAGLAASEVDLDLKDFVNEYAHKIGI